MEATKHLKKREEIQEDFKWRITDIYASDEVWEKDFEELKKKAPSLKNFEGKLNTKEGILGYLVENEKISRDAEKLYIYAHLRSDENTANSKYQNMRNRIDSYMAEFATYSAYFVPEILSTKDGFIEELINTVPEMKDYEFLLKDILKEKPHTLTKQEEEMLAALSDALDAPSSIYSIFTNAEMKFGKIIDEDGEEVTLTEGNYSNFVRSKDRKVREQAFKTLFGEYKKYENTLATTLSSSIKCFNVGSKIRKYNCPLEASLKPNNIPLDVYKNAIDTINKNLSALHRYVSIKKKLLKLDEIHMYDLYAPIFDVPKEKIAFEDGVKTINDALKPLGRDYLSVFNEGIKDKWIDIYENEGKRGGAYSWGGYDTKPYVLLNYNYSINDVSTLAHEMGHSLHSYYSRKEQSYYYASYTLFCAEVASTTNEALLINYLIEKEQDKSKKLYLINQELEQIRTTVFRQLMFAEFELWSHDSLANGNALTSEDFNAKWHELNVKYFGPDMIVDEEIDIEWSRIPHFYNDYYVYQYATGYAAATAFANSILNKEEGAVDKYIGFLKSGGSDYPIEILRKAGVDMESSEPLEVTISKFNELLDMIESSI